MSQLKVSHQQIAIICHCSSPTSPVLRGDTSDVPPIVCQRDNGGLCAGSIQNKLTERGKLHERSEVVSVTAVVSLGIDNLCVVHLHRNCSNIPVWVRHQFCLIDGTCRKLHVPPPFRLMDVHDPEGSPQPIVAWTRGIFHVIVAFDTHLPFHPGKVNSPILSSLWWYSTRVVQGDGGQRECDLDTPSSTRTRRWVVDGAAQDFGGCTKARIIPPALVEDAGTVLIPSIRVRFVEAQVPPDTAGIHLKLFVEVIRAVWGDENLVIIVREYDRVVLRVVGPHLHRNCSVVRRRTTVDTRKVPQVLPTQRPRTSSCRPSESFVAC
eukprot:m.148377 g.148377  ORF g.148377 m.148377 type:complete len:322 (+) comp14208_c0_seq1:44-1009(+)